MPRIINASTSRIAQSQPPLFFAKLATTVATGSGVNADWSETDATWTTEVNYGGGFSSGVFTAPIDGYYEFHAGLYTNPGSGTYGGMYFHGTGISSIRYAFRSIEGSADHGVSLSHIEYFTAGQTCKIAAYYSADSTARPDGTYWHGKWIAG